MGCQPDLETDVSLIMTGQNFCLQKQEGKEKELKDLPPVKETDVNQSDKDPKNHSGCVIS